MNFEEKKQKRIVVLCGAIEGALVFLSIWGIAVLNPFNDSWIFEWYNCSDITAHYGGWLGYWHSPWNYPLGFIENVGKCTTVTYTDSIPLMAVIFKLLLSTTNYVGSFQYFGIYTFVCYILQGIGAALLLHRRIKNIPYVTVAVAFFLLNPVLISRSFYHVALTAHWLILFALYFSLKYRDLNYSVFPISLPILSVISLLIHPYLFAMVLFIFLLFVIDGYIRTRNKRLLVVFISSLGLCFLIGLIFGVFSMGLSTNRNGGGYGLYSLNMNGFINPYDDMGVPWSKYITGLESTVFQKEEGVMYVGLGILTMGSIVLVSELIQYKRIINHLKKNYLYIIGMVVLTIFAISNVGVCSNKVLWEFELPKNLKNIADLFRASQRFAWPAYYSMFLVVFYDFYDICKKNSRSKQFCLLLAVMLFFIMQVVDISDAIISRRRIWDNNMRTDNLSTLSSLDEMLSGYDYLISLDTDDVESGYIHWSSRRSTAAYALRKGMCISWNLSSNVDYDFERNYARPFKDGLKNKAMTERVLYVTENALTAEQYKSSGFSIYACMDSLSIFYLIYEG